jgi:UDP-N-acetylglucosamine 2-epimerase
VAELVGTDVEKIVDRATSLLQGGDSRGAVLSPYGDGRASARIVEVLKTGALTESFAPGPVRIEQRAPAVTKKRGLTGS